MSKFGRVEMWRGGPRFCPPDAAPFVRRCLNGRTVTPFSHRGPQPLFHVPSDQFRLERSTGGIFADREDAAFARRTPKDDIHSLSLGYRFLGRATLCRTLPYKTFDFYQHIFFTFV